MGEGRKRKRGTDKIKGNQEKRETEHREKENEGKQDVCNYNTGDMIVEKNA